MLAEEERKLVEKLRRIEALFAGTSYDGERDAAAEAIERIRRRLRKVQQTDRPIEYKFTKLDTWSRRLMLALLRRYGLKPYRYTGQRYTTVMARVPVSFMEETLWPLFMQLSDTLRAYLDDVTHRVIREGINADASDAEIRLQTGGGELELPLKTE